jgi:hypothetical protein
VAEIDELIKLEENGLNLKRNHKYKEAEECFDKILECASDSKIHQKWRIEVITAE